LLKISGLSSSPEGMYPYIASGKITEHSTSSDTTANTLANALFYLAKNEDTQRKLRSQLDNIVSGEDRQWSYAKVKEVSFIDDIINETLRLKPPVIQGTPRETPSQGVHVAGEYIPGHVIASVPNILIQRDPRYWKQANEFIPERFGERREEMGTDDSPWIPFQIGKSTADDMLPFLTCFRYARMRG
jgi:cytochrome P450